MVMFPQSNARLTSIARDGYTEDYDTASGTPDAIWTGNVDAYVQSKLMSAFNDRGELNRAMVVTLIIPGDLPVMVEPGDTLTYVIGDPRSPITMVGRIQSLNNPAELASLPDYFKCTMEKVQAIQQ